MQPMYSRNKTTTRALSMPERHRKGDGVASKKNVPFRSVRGVDQGNGRSPAAAQHTSQSIIQETEVNCGAFAQLAALVLMGRPTLLQQQTNDWAKSEWHPIARSSNICLP
jgi:hypothetical protein